MMETSVMQADLLAGRLIIYSDLAQCFYYPTGSTLDLLSKEIETHLPFFQLVNLELRPHLDKIKKWEQSYQEEKFALLDLQREYTRLFINARPKALAPPYGSLYLENEGMTWGKTTVEAAKLYAEAGLKIADHFKDIPDHFAAETEFMSYLIREEMKARGLSQVNQKVGVDFDRALRMSDLQARFMNDHLGRWHNRFLDTVRTSTRLVFYHEISLLAKHFITEDLHRLLKNSAGEISL